MSGPPAHRPRRLARSAVRDARFDRLEEFIDECHSVLICYFWAVVGMENTKDILAQEYEGNTPVTIELAENDATDLVRTRILGNEAIEMFSSGGRFERLQARSLVTYVFTEWESVTRRKITTLLGVKSEDVRSDLMGDWRRLRNWLLHKDGDARGWPDISARGVGSLKSRPLR